MSSIPPSLPPSGPASVPTPPATTATVVNATPAQLAQLASGAVLETTGASSQPASGLVQVQSAAGALLLKLALPVVDGSTLRLQVVSLGTLPVLRVIAVNGQPLAAGGQPLLTAAKDSLIGAAPLNLWPNLQDLPPPGAEKSNLSAPLDPLRDLPGLTSPGFLATVVRPSGLNAPAALPNGSSFTVRINALQLPDSSGAALPPAFDTPQAAAPPAPPAANSQASRAYAAFASLPLPNAPQPGAPQLAGPTFPAAQPDASPPPPAATTAPALAPSLPGFVPSPANAPDAAQKANAAPPPASAAAALPTATSAPAGQGGVAAPPPPSPAITATTDHPLPSLPPTPLTPALASGLTPQETTAAAPAAPAASDSGPPTTSTNTLPAAPAHATAAAPASAEPLPPLPSSLQGVVASNSYAGRPLIQTPLGLLSLSPAADLPAGTRVELTVTSPAAPPPAPPPSLQTTPGQTVLNAGSWPAFDNALGALEKIDPQIAQAVSQRLPEVGPRLVPAMIALTAAVETGSLGNWLGQGPVKLLERSGRRDVTLRLESDLAALKVPVETPLPGDWQSLTLPLAVGKAIEQIRLTVRKPPEDEEEAKAREEEGSRFLLDLEMSQLGALQFDGLVKRRAKRFDLVIRSHTPLAKEIRRDISGIFLRALEGLGMVGEASFQQAVNFIDPIPVERASVSGLLI